MADLYNLDAKPLCCIKHGRLPPEPVDDHDAISSDSVQFIFRHFLIALANQPDVNPCPSPLGFNFAISFTIDFFITPDIQPIIFVHF